MTEINLGNPPPHHSYSVSLEREESAQERNLRLFKDLVLFLVAIAFVILIVFLCCRTLLSGKASVEEQKWAMSVLSAATGGVIGYLIRK